MPQYDLTADAWVELVPAGGADGQMITVGMGEALVSIGVPSALKAAVKLGGASRRDLSDARTLVVDAGLSVSARPYGPRVILTIGSAASIVALSSFALTFSDGTPLQFSDGSYIELSA